MKIFIVIALLSTLCILTLCQDAMEDMKKIGDACMEENKSTRSDFENLMSGKLKAAEAPDSMKCSVKCFMEKNNFLDPATGQLKTDILKGKLKDKAILEALDKAIAACKDLKGANPCDTAFQIMMCMWQNKVLKD